MKNLNIFTKTTARLGLLAIMLLAGILSFAQDSIQGKNVITTTTTTEEWYMSPLYIIVGIAVLLLVIMVLTRGRRKS